MRVAVSKKRLKKVAPLNTRTPTPTRRLNRLVFVQVRAIKSGRVSAWSKAKRLRFVKPRHAASLCTARPGRETPCSASGPAPTPVVPAPRPVELRARAQLHGRAPSYRMFYVGCPSRRSARTPTTARRSSSRSRRTPTDVLPATTTVPARGSSPIPSTAGFGGRYWHEPEDDIEDGRFTPAQYRAAWEHIMTLAPRRSTPPATLILTGFSLLKKSRHQRLRPSGARCAGLGLRPDRHDEELRQRHQPSEGDLPLLRSRLRHRRDGRRHGL